MKRKIAWIAFAMVCVGIFSATYIREEAQQWFMFHEHSQERSARVTWIEDGDTITVTFEGQSQVLRLYLIDAPEKGEPYSRKATTFLRDHILNEVVRIQEVGRMNHGRLLAFVWLEGEMVNLSLLREGLAYLAVYHPEEEAYREQAKSAVEEAQRNKKGVWW